MIGNVKHIRMKLAVLLASFTICVMAYVMDDKIYFDLMKLTWQLTLIGLLLVEYKKPFLTTAFIITTVCTGVYLLPYKAYTDIPCLLIENGLLFTLYYRYRQYLILGIFNGLILISSGYGLIKEVVGYGCSDTLTDLVLGSFTVMTTIIIFTIMIFSIPHKDHTR